MSWYSHEIEDIIVIHIADTMAMRIFTLTSGSAGGCSAWVAKQNLHTVARYSCGSNLNTSAPCESKTKQARLTQLWEARKTARGEKDRKKKRNPVKG
jgi:hypothetical protein